MTKGLNGASIGIFFVVVFGLVGGCGQSHSTGGGMTYADMVKKSKEEAQAPVPEIYRPVSRQDGIRFWSQMDSYSLVNGEFNAEGFQFGVIGDDGKKIRIALASSTVARGEIKTVDFGILKQEVASATAGQMFATESQITKLRALVRGEESGGSIGKATSTSTSGGGGPTLGLPAPSGGSAKVVGLPAFGAYDLTPLCQAAQAGQAAAVKQLLAAGANVNAAATNGSGVTPLMLASQQGHADVVKLLLSAGAIVNVVASNGVTPLILASQQGHSDIVQLLTAAGGHDLVQVATVPASPSGTTSNTPPSAGPKAATTADTQSVSGQYWTDPATHLTWIAHDNGRDYTWDGAKAFCANLTTAGFKWTLPTLEQLETVIDLRTNNITRNIQINGGKYLIPGPSPGRFITVGVWSSSTPKPGDFGYGPGEASAIQLLPRAEAIQHVSETYRALCVRRAE